MVYIRKYFLVLYTLVIPAITYPQYQFNKKEVTVNIVLSPYQEDTTSIFTFYNGMQDNDSIVVIFLLPVENQRRIYEYGSAIEEVKILADSGLIRDNVIFIQPEFSTVPWYGDHPSDSKIQQEKYLLEIIRDVQSEFREYFTRTYLLGFSKSGWGSMSMLLNHPDLIDGVFIWDAPLTIDRFPKWAMQKVFSDENYYNSHYNLANRLDRQHTAFQSKTIVVGGYDYFRKESTDFLKQLDGYGVKYLHDTTLNFQHKWDRNWIYPLLKDGKIL